MSSQRKRNILRSDVQIQYVRLTWLFVQQKVLVFFIYNNNQAKFQTQLTSKTEHDRERFTDFSSCSCITQKNVGIERGKIRVLRDSPESRKIPFVPSRETIGTCPENFSGRDKRDGTIEKACPAGL